MGSVALPLIGHIDAALSTFAKGFTQNDLVADIVCPRVPVGRQADLYYIHGREGQQLTEQVLRAAGSPAQRTRLTLSTAAFFCKSHSLAADIAMESQAAYAVAGDLAQDVVQDQMAKILLDKEVAAAALLTSTANFTNNTTLAGANQWSDPQSNPLDDVETGRQKVMLSGQTPNIMIIPPAVFQKLKSHPLVRDSFKYTSPGAIGLAQLQSFFQIDRILLAAGVIVDKAGAATFVWGKDVFLGYISATTGLRDMSAAKTFVWTGGPGTIAGIGTVRAPHPDPTAKSEIVGTDFYYDQKMTALEAGYVIKAAVA